MFESSTCPVLIPLPGIHTPHASSQVCACQYPQTNKFSLSLSQPFLHFPLLSFFSFFLSFFFLFYCLSFMIRFLQLLLLLLLLLLLQLFLLLLLLQLLPLLLLTKCTWRDFSPSPALALRVQVLPLPCSF